MESGYFIFGCEIERNCCLVVENVNGAISPTGGFL